MTRLAKHARRWLAITLTSLAALAGGAAHADAGALRATHAQLRERLENNPFQRPMHVESAETGDSLRGDVYAVLDHPFAKVSQGLQEASQWCDVMILPFNTKYCHAVDGANATRLNVRIGRKSDQPVDQAYRLDFDFRNVAADADYYESRLNARNGPMGTRDYRITVAAIPIGNGRTFVHLSYSYGFGVAGRLAMQGYLATVGADKVGFSSTGKDEKGQPQFIGGVRGAVERTAMRYYLAIDAYLASLDAPQAQRVEKRLQGWFSATEHYPRQLREMDRSTYVAMKRQEYERQQTALQ